MRERGVLARLIALGAVVIATTATALVLLWMTSDWQSQVNDFYESTDGEQILDEEYRTIDELSYRSYLIQGLTPPLLLAGAVAVLALLAALAWRWETAARPDQADAEEPTTAS